jgi:hypothetical protein
MPAIDSQTGLEPQKEPQKGSLRTPCGSCASRFAVHSEGSEC